MREIYYLFDTHWKFDRDIFIVQKYRLYLSRLQKENGLKASFGGVKQLDLSSRDTAASLGLQNTIIRQQSDAASGSYGISSNKTLVQNVDPKIHEGDLKGIVSLPMAEPKKAPVHDIPDPPLQHIRLLQPN